MAYTSHGHHIPGTVKFDGDQPPIDRCGGLNLCRTCKREVAAKMADGGPWENPTLDKPVVGPYGLNEPVDYQKKARDILKHYVDTRRGEEGRKYFIYVVWFAKSLQNWKALMATTLEDGMYYELTHNGDRDETYIDAYSKIDNVVVKD